MQAPSFLIRDGLAADASVIATYNAALAQETENLLLERVFGVRGAGLDAPAFGFAIVLHGGFFVLHGLVTAYFLATEGISLRGSLARVRGTAPADPP
jgi:hypothetical protein